MTSRSGECFWARWNDRTWGGGTAERGYSLSEQRGSITQGLGVHTRVLEQQVGHHVQRPSIYRSTWARITLGSRINLPTDSSSSPESTTTQADAPMLPFPRPYLVRSHRQIAFHSVIPWNSPRSTGFYLPLRAFSLRYRRLIGFEEF